MRDLKTILKEVNNVLDTLSLSQGQTLRLYNNHENEDVVFDTQFLIKEFKTLDREYIIKSVTNLYTIMNKQFIKNSLEVGTQTIYIFFSTCTYDIENKFITDSEDSECITLFSTNISHKCPKCNTTLENSILDGYDYYCQECDEDFYKCEVK